MTVGVTVLLKGDLKICGIQKEVRFRVEVQCETWIGSRS